MSVPSLQTITCQWLVYCGQDLSLYATEAGLFMQHFLFKRSFVNVRFFRMHYRPFSTLKPVFKALSEIPLYANTLPLFHQKLTLKAWSTLGARAQLTMSAYKIISMSEHWAHQSPWGWSGATSSGHAHCRLETRAKTIHQAVQNDTDEAGSFDWSSQRRVSWPFRLIDKTWTLLYIYWFISFWTYMLNLYKVSSLWSFTYTQGEGTPVFTWIFFVCLAAKCGVEWLGGKTRFLDHFQPCKTDLRNTTFTFKLILRWFMFSFK